MEANYRYTLEKGNKKHYCPICTKKTFKRYIDTISKEYLAGNYGRCNREANCNTHLFPPLETLCFYVPFDNLKSITPKAMVLKQGTKEHTIPKKAIFEQLSKGIYIAEYILKKKDIEYLSNDCKYFSDTGATSEKLTIITPPPTNEKPIYFDNETFKQTLNHYDKNIFIQNLLHRVQFPFEVNEVSKVYELYQLGTITSDYRKGAITFPFIDVNNNVRAIQVKQFDEENHTTETGFLHSMIKYNYAKNNTPLPYWLEAYLKQDKRITCLFGEHLLNKYPKNPIALVEAPKTAIYGTLYFGIPKTDKCLIWIAVYNKSSLSFDKIKVLQGRKIIVFPDLSKNGSTFAEWETKAKDYEKRLKNTRFIFSNLLEQLAPEQDKNNGKDLADYLIKEDWRKFRTPTPPPTPPTEPEKVTGVTKVSHKTNIIFSHAEPLPKVEAFKTDNCFSDIKKEPPLNWSNDITELENYFASFELPTEPIKLNVCTTITDCNTFVSSHIATIKAYNGKSIVLPYVNRLKNLKQILL